MPEDTADPPSRGPIDTEILDRIATHLARSDRLLVHHGTHHLGRSALKRRSNPSFDLLMISH